jgi:F0F1-type ATP synthase gamma subunit
LAAAGPAALVPVRGSGPGAVLLVVLTSEQPLCGGFNHAVVDHALEARRERLVSSKVQVVAVGQFAYISLYHAAAESYASEQGSRLVAMDGATRNTGRMVDELTCLERRERQQEITRQMLELTASRLIDEGD